MRKVTKHAVTAFLAGKPATCGNTRTDGNTLYLFDKCIAWKAAGRAGEAAGTITMTLAGYPTATTRDRLNGLCQLATGHRPFAQKAHEQYFNGKYISANDTVSIYPTRL